MQYLEEWEEIHAQEYQNSAFITSSTCYGMKITIKAVMQLTEYLCHSHGYEYLLTTRVNQDKLEVRKA